jgi:hypothetical protein
VDNKSPLLIPCSYAPFGGIRVRKTGSTLRSASRYKIVRERSYSTDGPRAISIAGHAHLQARKKGHH